jgi:hypothetical protein
MLTCMMSPTRRGIGESVKLNSRSPGPRCTMVVSREATGADTGARAGVAEQARRSGIEAAQSVPAAHPHICFSIIEGPATLRRLKQA